MKFIKRLFRKWCKHSELKVYKQLFEDNMRSIETYRGILKYIQSQQSYWNVYREDIAYIDMEKIRQLEYEVLIFKDGELISHPRLEKEKKIKH